MLNTTVQLCLNVLKSVTIIWVGGSQFTFDNLYGPSALPLSNKQFTMANKLEIFLIYQHFSDVSLDNF